MTKFSPLAFFVTAAIGFGIGWIAKPAPIGSLTEAAADPIARRSARASRPVHDAAPSPVEQGLADQEPFPSVADRPEIAGPQPGALSAEIGAGLAKAREMREAAKWLRLVEVLGLSDAQRSDLDASISDLAESLEENRTGTPAFQDGAQAAAEIAKLGSALDSLLTQVLSSAQREALDGMLRQERENRIDAVVRRELADLIGSIDLTPDQREAVALRLRESAEAEIPVLPRELELMVDTSVLPLGALGVGRDTIETMRGLPGKGAGDFQDQRLREMAERQEILRGILTPGQIARFEALAEEQRVILQQMRSFR
jgi:hypothetical protein